MGSCLASKSDAGLGLLLSAMPASSLLLPVASSLPPSWAVAVSGRAFFRFERVLRGPVVADDDGAVRAAAAASEAAVAVPNATSGLLPLLLLQPLPAAPAPAAAARLRVASAAAADLAV